MEIRFVEPVPQSEGKHSLFYTYVIVLLISSVQLRTLIVSLYQDGNKVSWSLPKIVKF